MNASEDLEKTLNAIRQEFSAVPVLCIPWLHLKHPIHPVQEMLLRSERVPRPRDAAPASWGAGIAHRVARSRSRFLRGAFCLANGFRLGLKLLRLRSSMRSSIAAILGRSFPVVAKSWCFGPVPAAASERDFYYGDLQKRLADRGVNMLLLCGDANDTNWQTFAANCVSTSSNFRIPELALCRPWSAVNAALEQIRVSWALWRRAKSAIGPRAGEAARQASLDCLDPSVTQDSLYFEIASTAVRHWKPRAFVTLYEGHGWEKAAWWGAKTEDPSCRSVGYQHTAVFSEALSLIRPFVDVRERSVPDIVLALGDQTTRLLSVGHRAHGTQLLRFGTFRRQTAAASRPADPGLRTILVLPEGIAAEADALFRFAYDAAGVMPDHHFILRGHPQWPAQKALNRIEPMARSAKNVEVSAKPAIDDDFSRASVVLYRGSSAALYGILNGLLAVNLRLSGMIDSDPIYELTEWRKACTTPQQFREIVQEFEQQTPAVREAEWRRAADYVNRYIVPVEDAGIDSFLDAAGIQRANLCTA